MSDFQYTTIDQQIEKLKSQKLIINNERQAKINLMTYGYYNIINGYRDPYIIRENGKKTYSPNVTFEQIYALFALDHKLRNSVILSMIDLEEHLRALVSEVISQSFGTCVDDYLDNHNYKERRVSNAKFSRNNLLQYMRDIAETTYKEPVRYYREEKGIVPPWILLKATDFGTLTNYIRLFKRREKDILLSMLYGEIDTSEIVLYKDLMSDTLSFCLDYRNMAAHGGRIYNYVPNSIVRHPDVQNIASLGVLLFCLSKLKYPAPYKIIDTTLSAALDHYCKLFPNDIERLGNAIGAEIHFNN